VFSWQKKNTPSGAKMHRESTEPESRQTAKFLSSSDGLVQICVLFHDGFRTKQQHFSLSRAPAHRFFQVWSHTRPFKPLTEELWLPLRRHFSSRVRMRTNHLAMKCYYARLLNEKYCWCAGSVSRKPVILQPILHRKPVRGDLLLCNRWQTLSSSMHLLLKKWHEQE